MSRRHLRSRRGIIHTPRYLLRRRIILNLLSRYEPGRFLEIGCGRGELMPWLAARGFTGVGVEISPQALEVARKAVRSFAPRLRVVSDLEQARGEPFDYVFAFEVLEHVEDDDAALRLWRSFLKPRGRLVLTVPAHMAKWTTADEAGGHYRRYERRELHQLLNDLGYDVERFWSYGFPLTALTYRLRNRFYGSARTASPSNRRDRTLGSSFDSTRGIRWGGSLVAALLEGMADVFHLAQLAFRRSDLGDGYIVAARPVEGRSNELVETQ